NNQYERAIELFSKGINLNQSNPEIFLQRGIAYYNRSQYDQSSSDMKQVLFYDPGNYTAKKWLGKIQFMRGNFDEAFTSFKELHENKALKDEDDLEWYDLISDSAYKFHLNEAKNDIQKGDMENAVRELNLCCWIKPEEPEPICQLSELYINREEPWLSARELSSYSGENKPCILYYKALTSYILADFQGSLIALNTLKNNFQENSLVDDLIIRLKKEENSQLIRQFKEISSSTALFRSDFAFLTVLRIFPHIALKFTEGIIVTDIADSDLKKYIYLVVEMGAMPVFPNHTFKPDKVLNRREFVILIQFLMKKIGINPDDYLSTAPYVDCIDLPPESSYYNTAQNLLRMKLLSPLEDHTFKGEENITGKDAISCFDKLAKLLSKN
ncbi:tetratricopeptide repeat protein, partial [bacterium]|nr:tetratricopeptide repeat protein [bacterium]